MIAQWEIGRDWLAEEKWGSMPVLVRSSAVDAAVADSWMLRDQMKADVLHDRMTGWGFTGRLERRVRVEKSTRRVLFVWWFMPDAGRVV